MRFFVDLPIRHRRCTVVQIQSDLPNARMVEWAPGFIPFTRASSADLSGKRATGCLRGRSPRVLWLPDKSSNAANPQGRVVGCPGGLLRGAGQAAPLGSPGRRKSNSATAQCRKRSNEREDHLEAPDQTTKNPHHCGFSCLLESHSHRLDPDPGAMQVESKGRPGHQTDHHNHRVHHRLALAVADTGSAITLA